jgi:uncharacterized protein
MKEQKNVQALRHVMDAFRQGDSQSFIDLLSDDVDFQHPMPHEIWPWAGKQRGKAAVEQAFAGLAATVHFEMFEPREFIAQGDQVAVLVFERARVKATNISIDNHYVHVYTNEKRPNCADAHLRRYRSYNSGSRTESLGVNQRISRRPRAISQLTFH